MSIGSSLEFRRLLLGTVAVCATAVCQPALAQTKAFDVPAQSAATGVAVMARQADVQILISAADAQGRRVNAVRGAYPVDQALSLLLAGTGLSAQATGPSAYTVVAQRPSARAGQSGAVTGAVTDGRGESFLSGAEVRVAGLGVVAVTNSEGRYTLRGVPAGQHTLIVSYFGRPTHEMSVFVEDGQTITTNITFGVSGSATTVDDIVVTGSRPQAESEAAALQVQRSSLSLVNVVAADAIGRFPDQNVAAALSRLPGVAVTRDQGQERTIQVRGAPARWTTIAYDGVNVISPSGRSARMDTSPSAIANSVQMRKAITAAMPGESLAGNINIVTRGAFDYPGFKAAADLGLGYNDLGGGDQYTIGGFVSNTFADGLFGVLLSASRYEREMVTDNFEAQWEVAPEDREPGWEERTWVHRMDHRHYRLVRGNMAFTGRLDFRPSDEHRFFFSSIYTEYSDDELRDTFVFDFDQNAVSTTNTGSPLSVQRTNYADVRTGNTPLSGTLYGVDMDPNFNARALVESIFTNTLGGEQRFGAWRASWRLNHTLSKSDEGPEFYSNWVSPADRTLRPSVVYDFTDPDMFYLNLFKTVRNTDGTFALGSPKNGLGPEDFLPSRLRWRSTLGETQAYSAKLDLSRDVSMFGHRTELSFGLQYDSREKENNRTIIDIVGADLVAAGVAPPSLSDIQSEDAYRGRLPLGYSFRYFSESAAWDLLNGLLDRGIGNVVQSATVAEYYKVGETVAAGYAMGVTYFNWGNLVAGVRVERTENTSEALVNTGAGYAPLELSDDNLEVFPSLHLNWDINDEMKLRLSANTGAARPNFTELRPNFSIDDAEQAISGGNPSAGPEKAVGLDVYFEWYRPGGAFLSAGVYYKDLSDVLFNVRRPFGSDALNSGGVDRSGYAFSTIDNGGSGYLRGLEFAYSQTLDPYVEQLGLPDWAGGFGLRGNLSLNDSQVTTPDGREVSLSGASDLVYNAALSYERYGLSARVSWQYRSEYLGSLGAGDILGDLYIRGVGRLDVSARYAVNDHAEIYFDANNLLDEPGVRYYGESWRTAEYERFGARYMLGVRLNF